MKTTAIKTVSELKSAVFDALRTGTMALGSNAKEFAANVSEYIDYCDNYGYRPVYRRAVPAPGTLNSWYREAVANAAD